jgi:hypothetical protein
LSSWAGPAGGDSLQLVRGVIESLTCAPNGATVVVGVDDAPLLDDLSIFVVHQIVQRGGAKVVLTVRDDELSCEPGISRHGLLSGGPATLAFLRSQRAST